MKKRYNIVFDIHETLVTILFNEKKITKRSLTENRVFHLWSIENNILKPYYVVKRPFLDQLLRFCEENFNIFVWSLGTRADIEQIVKHIFNKQPELIITRETCPHPIKSLTYLKHITNRAVDLTNTIQVDDRSISIADNKRNGILIPPFVNDDNDFCLEILHSFLRRLINEFRDTNKDIRDIDKNIFTSDCMSCNRPLLIAPKTQISKTREIPKTRKTREIKEQMTELLTSL
jgi:hypothetical protein